MMKVTRCHWLQNICWPRLRSRTLFVCHRLCHRTIMMIPASVTIQRLRPNKAFKLASRVSCEAAATTLFVTLVHRQYIFVQTYLSLRPSICRSILHSILSPPAKSSCYATPYSLKSRSRIRWQLIPSVGRKVSVLTHVCQTSAVIIKPERREIR